MKIIYLKEQQPELLPDKQSDDILPLINEGENVSFTVRRGRGHEAVCLTLERHKDIVKAVSSYFIGVDWVKKGELAVMVEPKLNHQREIDFVKMLNDALCEPENFRHLQDLVTIKFDQPSIVINQQQDLLSVFLITEYLNILQRIVKKGLKKSYYIVEENLKNKIKGRLIVCKNIKKNLTKRELTKNVCQFQVYDIDSPENRVLKKALTFCAKQLEVFSQSFDTTILRNKIRYIKPYFVNVGDDVSVNEIKDFKKNPMFKDYNQAIEFAQLLLRRYSYNVSKIGTTAVQTPPFWIDMSKLFELYVYSRLRKVFTAKGEVKYHYKAHYQELDFLLNPDEWHEPYVIDAKYKPYYKNEQIIKEDARQVSGYARLTNIYKALNLDEDTSPPIKCLIIYPDQEANETFTFSRMTEPQFERVNGYIRFYKMGLRLPELPITSGHL